VVTLDDGHRVGVSIGGHGVPVVFLHGLGLSGRTYVRLLSRLAGMGFLVVVLDAAGHGGTPNLPRDAADLACLRAIIASGDYTPMLDAMRELRVPTIVVHGEKDLVVPFESAHDMAERADGALYRVPGAYHSWMLANQRHGADRMRQLLAAELGDALRASARAHDVQGCVTCWADALLSDDSPLRRLNDGPLDVVGTEAAKRVTLDHLCAGPHRAPNPRRRNGTRRVGRFLGRRRGSLTA
jgi:fermentation-respiration switch protein FrsA (DUF1100 family)